MFDAAGSTTPTAAVVKLQIFQEKHQPGTELREATAVSGHGFEGDRHCMAGRPLSVTDESLARWIAEQEYDGFCFKKFKANIIFDDMSSLHAEQGARIQVGGGGVDGKGATLRIESNLKKCYEHYCELYNQGVPCKVPDLALFGFCERGGTISLSDIAIPLDA